MNRKEKVAIAGLVFVLSGCSTLNESFQLGATTGMVTGMSASYAGYKAAGLEPTLKNVAAGGGIGVIAGLLASYFVHKAVEEDRRKFSSGDPEIHFGDLPPNPFLAPKTNNRGK